MDRERWREVSELLVMTANLPVQRAGPSVMCVLVRRPAAERQLVRRIQLGPLLAARRKRALGDHAATMRGVRDGMSARTA